MMLAVCDRASFVGGAIGDIFDEGLYQNGKRRNADRGS